MTVKNSCFVLRKYMRCSIYDLENISTRRIGTTSPKNFNDPLDSYCFDFTDKCITTSLEKLIPRNKQDSLRMACFADHSKMLEKRKKSYTESLSNDEILMWTHYSNSHQGICVEYAIPRTNFKSIDEFDSTNSTNIYLQKVDYIDQLAVNYEHIITEKTDGGNPKHLLQSIYFLKDNTFKYEHEYRLLSFESDMKKYSPIPFDYIKKIIFGLRCSCDTRRLIECINKQVYNSKIELFSIDKNFREVAYESR